MGFRYCFGLHPNSRQSFTPPPITRVPHQFFHSHDPPDSQISHQLSNLLVHSTFTPIPHPNLSHFLPFFYISCYFPTYLLLGFLLSFLWFVLMSSLFYYFIIH